MKMKDFRIWFLLPLLFGWSSAVTIIPATFHLPKPYEKVDNINVVSTEGELLLKSIPNLDPDGTKISHVSVLFAGHLPLNQSLSIYPSQDSFVRGAIDAWAQHQHFVMRPEDVWFTILNQLNFYLTNRRNNPEVRDRIAYRDYVDISSYNWLNIWPETNKVVKREFKQWLKANWTTYSFIQPNFTTTTYNDRTVANLIGMGSKNNTSLGYSTSLCGGGMPSVTLLGTERDWQDLLLKLDNFVDFGPQLADYSKVLRPILSRFVKSFTDPNAMNVRQFWDDAVDSGSKRRDCLETGSITGWITGFHYWDQSGRLIPRGSGPIDDEEGLIDGDKESRVFRLDGAVYPWRDLRDLPDAYAGIHYRNQYRQGCVTYLGELLGGMIGKKIVKGKPKDYTLALERVGFSLPTTLTEDQHSILQPFSRWFQYEDSRNADPPALPGEDANAHTQRICTNRPDGNRAVYNFPCSRDNMLGWPPPDC
jgi:hypothetical protein